jgi:membrane-bound serine protease (ClpP class)
MVKGAGIGAATVVNETGDAAPDKYQSYMRGIIRATAEAHGKDTVITGKDTTRKWIRDPRIAEAMVDQTIAIPHINDSGKVITFTTEEAIKYGYCDGIANNVEELIEQQLHYTNNQLITYEPSLFDEIKGFLLNPVLQGFLIMIIIAGIYFEMQSPGVGFPSFAAGVAALLYFTPLYINGLAENWEIILFIIGLILVALEIFVVPGFGITGISGIILSVSGLTLALLNNRTFDFGEVRMPDVSRSLLTVMSGIILGFALMIYLSSRIGEAGFFKKIALDARIDASIVSPEERNSLPGKTGIAVTVLRPSGKVMINNEIYDAIAETAFIDEGATVTVTRQEAAQIYVA